MKKLLMVLGFVLLNVTVQAQILKPVKWGFTASQVNGKAGMYEIRMTATVDKGWHIYSQHTPAGGPNSTVVLFKANPLVMLGGKVTEEGKMHKEHSEVFGVDVFSYEAKVSFVQIVKLKKPGVKTSLSWTVEFMACTDEQCLPPEVGGV